jgi:hypothetical protein
MLMVLSPGHEGRLLEDDPEDGASAAPAGGDPNPALGRPWEPDRGALGPLRRELGWTGTGPQGPRPMKRGPGAENRRQWSAERRLSANGEDTPRQRGRAGRSRGFANPCIFRRSAPLAGRDARRRRTPAPQPIGGGGALAARVRPKKHRCIREIPRCAPGLFLAISARFPVGVKRTQSGHPRRSWHRRERSSPPANQN